MNLGKFIRAAREERGITQDELARLADIDPMSVWRIETGKVKTPGIDTITKVARALGVSIDSLLATKKET